MGKFTVLALLLALTLASCGAPGDVGVQQGTIDIDNVEVIDMQSLLDEAAEESKFSVFINSNIVMKTSGDDANVLIQNSEDVDGFLPLNIQKNTDLVPSQAKFNAWKMISPTCKNDTPGNIYEDKNKVFEFFNLAKDYSDGKNTEKRHKG